MKRLVLACVALALSASSQGQAAIFNPTTGHWYDLVNSGANGSWSNAETNAVGLGGHLVTINDAAEETWLRANFSSTIRYWIGYTDEVTEGTWLWANGETPGYENWDTGEPNDSMPPSYGEDYAVLNWVSTGEWNDWDHARPDYGAANLDGIVELTRNPDVPEPSTCAIWSLLVAMGMSSWRRRRACGA